MLVKLLDASPRTSCACITSAWPTGRAAPTPSSRAVERIVAWCVSRYRPFRYSESALDFRELEAIPIDYL